MELIATATFGLEAVVRRELEGLGFEILKTEDGKVTYAGDERAIVRSNLWLRTADRVLLKMAEFQAETFEELFDQVAALQWEKLIPEKGRFTVTGTSVKSKLHSVPACQSITKKAIASRLMKAYHCTWLTESGPEYTVKVTMLKDRATITVDTSGAALHKRGYRIRTVEAPIKETMAAAMIQLSFWKPGRILIDPCCGSGTIPIEAALMDRGIAPGLSRSFASESWDCIDSRLWKEERQRAYAAINMAGGGSTAGDGSNTAPEKDGIRIFARDIDPAAIKAAKENAAEAGVDDCIAFERADIKTLTEAKEEFIRSAPENRPVIVTNLPYGHRINSPEEIRSIYKALRRFMKECPQASVFAITSDKDMEKAIGRKADRRRKLYNGNIETTYYQFHGAKPK